MAHRRFVLHRTILYDGRSSAVLQTHGGRRTEWSEGRGTSGPPASGFCWSWSGGEGVELAELAYTLPLFCWPPALWLERPTPHAFATTTNSGTRRFGFVIGWVETLSASLVTHSALVLLASTPIEWLYFEVLQLAHERIAGATGAAGI